MLSPVLETRVLNLTPILMLLPLTQMPLPMTTTKAAAVTAVMAVLLVPKAAAAAATTAVL
jgi:hypothetical protein